MTPSERPRVGLNAMLYSRSLTFRSAGVSHYVAGLLDSLPQADPDTDYYAFVAEPESHLDGWRVVHPVFMKDNPWRRIAWEQLFQTSALRRLKIDLLHAPVYVGPLRASCPVVVTIHDLSHFIYPELFKPAQRAYLQVMTRYTAQRAAAVICDSENTRRDVLRILHIPEQRVHTVLIAAGSEMQPLPPAVITRFRQERQLPERFILSVSTLEPRKNILKLIDAYALIVKSNAATPALYIGGGKGWYYQAIESRVEKLGLSNRIHFAGFIPQAELPLWYNAAEIFIYPSIYEGFGLPPLEAMACGTPVITSNRSSLPEVMGDGGVMVDSTVSENLAAEMQNLLENPDRRANQVSRGLQRAKLFTWANTARQTAAIYHAVLENR
ncbi:MAG: glycosyltransferase family 4 protein [Anaerolineae bacterium]